MIRKAKLTDFPLVFPILKQIFDEMDMDTIKALPESQFYDLMKHGFYSPHYRYSHNRMWVEADEMDRPVGIMVMYGYDDQGLIDISLKSSYLRSDCLLMQSFFQIKKHCHMNGIWMLLQFLPNIGEKVLDSN